MKTLYTFLIAVTMLSITSIANSAHEMPESRFLGNMFAFWIDTDDSKLYICYNQDGTVKTTELN